MVAISYNQYKSSRCLEEINVEPTKIKVDLLIYF